MKPGMTKIYRGEQSTDEHDAFSIETTAVDEKAFYESVSSAISKILYEMASREKILDFDEDIKQSKFELESEDSICLLLPLIVDIACKIKGYKSPVNEYRLLSTGRMFIQGTPDKFENDR